jgi:NAD(P)-dependent dehydrogenase (short-subunit alcohol dehydrogenase family)
MTTVAMVTGASRGLGRGIARGLGAEGFIVYVTGRDEAALAEVADEVRAAGGTPHVARCDHADDADVARLFERVRAETGGLDLLVNNAAVVHPELAQPGRFWEKSLGLSDMITVGLRSAYVAAYYAMPLMLERDAALIVNISFYGAVSYHYGPGYGAAKGGTDKMTYDMGIELAETPVSVVSLWPGLILTDFIKQIPQEYLPEEMRQSLPNWETPEFSGHVIAALLRDPALKQRSGKIVIGAEAAREYGIADAAGNQPPDYTATLGIPVSYPHLR